MPLAQAQTRWNLKISVLRVFFGGIYKYGNDVEKSHATKEVLLNFRISSRFWSQGWDLFYVILLWRWRKLFNRTAVLVQANIFLNAAWNAQFTANFQLKPRKYAAKTDLKWAISQNRAILFLPPPFCYKKLEYLICFQKNPSQASVSLWLYLKLGE